MSLDYFVLPQKELSFEEANNPDTYADNKVAKKELLVVAIQTKVLSKLRSVVSECNLERTSEVEIFSSVRANFEHELSPCS